MRAAKADANQKQLVAAFEGMGCSVEHLHRVGQGCPDVLVGVAGINLLVEIKDGKASLNEEQREWHAKWRGQVCIVRTVEEAVTLVKAVRAWKGVTG